MNRIQSNITHIQHTSVLPVPSPSAVYDPTTSFNPFLFHANISPPFCHLVTKICQLLHSHSCPPLWNKLSPALQQISDPSYELTQTSPLAISLHSSFTPN